MPLIQNSTYPDPPFPYKNGHLSTIFYGGLRRVPEPPYHRERLVLSDGDFIDLDWLRSGENDRLVILSHGLEGDSHRPYIRSLALYFHERGWDVLAWMCRSCSGELNCAPRLYHHGEIGDFGEVIEHARRGNYRQIALIGLSMGGNITLKYMGVHGDTVPKEITHAVAFSAPVDLGESAAALDRRSNFIYRRRFMKMLLAKMRAKEAQHPGLLDFSRTSEIRKWRDFDEFYSAPLSGFESAEEFYEQASALNFVSGIRRPTLLVNALDDPILSPRCYPYEFAEQHDCFYLETPRYGGHVAFPSAGGGNFGWAEERAYAWIAEGVCR